MSASAKRGPGRPVADPEQRRTESLQIRITPRLMRALERLQVARALEKARSVPLSEIALELIEEHPRTVRALAMEPAAPAEEVE